MLLLLLASLALGAETTSSDVARKAQLSPADVEWVRRPNGQDINQYYPLAAAERELQGRAVIDCTVTETGTLSGCRVVEEFPTGVGFGDAALKMSARYELALTTRRGAPVAGNGLRLPLRFSLPGRWDQLSAMYACYGVTAVAAENDPANALAGRAFGFFAAQAGMLVARGKGTPMAFEAGLQEGRVNASEATSGTSSGPTLKACLAIANANLK